MNTLKLKNLSVKLADGKKLIENVSLEIKQNEIHVIVGPNGVGKTSLINAIMNHPNYQKEGKILLNDKDITNEKTENIAKEISIAFQHVPEFENLQLRQLAWYIAQNNYNAVEFQKKLKELLEKLNIPESYLSRSTGFSGGEKKRIELMLCLLQKPKFLILDEIDSGVDIDNLKIFSKILNKIKQDVGIILISHNSRLLKELNIDKVHILLKTIIKSGNKELLDEIEKNGFKNWNN
ncbi:MAG: ATP-binding cassette domain-containing protein [Candidatus Woesearchaeota archaeon]